MRLPAVSPLPTAENIAITLSPLHHHDQPRYRRRRSHMELYRHLPGRKDNEDLPPYMAYDITVENEVGSHGHRRAKSSAGG